MPKLRDFLSPIKFIFLLLFAVSCTTPAPKPPAQICGPQLRAAFDVGSGTTKVKVAAFNLCENKVERIVFEQQEKVDFKESLSRNERNEFSESILQAGERALIELAHQARKRGAEQFAGVATAAFRTAKNGTQAIEKWNRKYHLNLRLVSQQEEAIMAHQAVLQASGIPTADLLVWDIGGGSQQIIYRADESSAPIIYYGNLGSVAFKNFLISELQRRDPKKIKSPNSIQPIQMAAAINYARGVARKDVPGKLKSLFSRQNIQVVGIGGVHAGSIKSQLKASEEYSLAQLRQTLNKRIGMTDAQIGGEYAATDISNLGLVLAFMEELKIPKVKIYSLNLTDSLFLDSTLWDNQNSPQHPKDKTK